MLWTSKSSQKSHKTSGDDWEKFAEHYLSQQGLRLVDKNFHSRHGEIDLIMQEDDCLIFIEVKYRKSAQFGGAINAVTKQKQQKLNKTAKFFLHQRGLNEYNTPCRFDVIAIEGDMKSPKITWLKNAF